ncbi:MAG: arylesterase [Sphingobium sp.]
MNAAEPRAAAVENAPLVVAFGDSLFAGYRLSRGEGFAPTLERKLAELGQPARIFDASVSGDTSAAGLQRLTYVLDGLPEKPDLVIVGLGSNDMLRGLKPDDTRKNLTAILDELDRRDIDVVLAGAVSAPNMGRDYADAFNPIYPDLAERYGFPLYPFILDGVIGNEKLLLPDGMHPNAKGVERMVSGIGPVVAKALDN